MSLADPSGFALRRNGSCLAWEQECGPTATPFHACCPSGGSCPQAWNVDCCPSAANCTVALVERPRCANASWTLYDNDGFFCCEPEKVGFRNNSYLPPSSGCADAGASLNGVDLLAVVEEGQTQTSSSVSSSTAPPSSSPSASPPVDPPADDGSSTSTGAIVGGVVGGVVAVILVVIAILLVRRRRNREAKQHVESSDNKHNQYPLHGGHYPGSHTPFGEMDASAARLELAAERPAGELPESTKPTELPS